MPTAKLLETNKKQKIIKIFQKIMAKTFGG